MSGCINAPSTTAAITAAMATAPAHLRPVLLAVRDFRVGMLVVPQGLDPFVIPKKPKRRAAVCIIADDTMVSLGPDGFHLPSLRRTIRACRAFAVVSSAATAEIYTALTTPAVAGQNAMIIETRLEHEFEWVGLIQKLAPGRPLLIATVKGGHA